MSVATVVRTPDARTPERLDPREVGRVVASVLSASGAWTQDDVARADAGLARLGRPALARDDFGDATPEELAPVVPPLLRFGVAALLHELAGADPLRHRVASAYAGLWSLATAQPAPPPRGSAVARLVVGALPSHQRVHVPEETSMHASTYRGADATAQVPPPRDPLRDRITRIHHEAEQVIATVERVIVGKRAVIARALTAMAARGHVLLMDTPGVGKTQLCKAIAASLGLRFGRVQFTPDLLPMDLTGASIYEAHEKRFTFRPGPIFTNILLADEINRATPKTQSGLLEVMQERTVTVDGVTYSMPEPFQVLATMNPLDHEGTFALPAAQMDRFMVMLDVGYPSAEDEVRVLDTHLASDAVVKQLSPVISAESFVEWQSVAALVHTAPEIQARGRRLRARAATHRGLPARCQPQGYARVGPRGAGARDARGA